MLYAESYVVSSMDDGDGMDARQAGFAWLGPVLSMMIVKREMEKEQNRRGG